MLSIFPRIMYKLILEDSAITQRLISYDPNATLDTLEYDCEVYCFVIGKSDLPEEFKNDLKNLGLEYKKNLYVGMWDMGDEKYNIVAQKCNLRKLPCIVMTAQASFSDVGNDQYLYIKIDGMLLETEHLNETKRLVREVYNLIIRGELQHAVKDAKQLNRKVFLVDLARKMERLSENFLRLLGDIGLSVEYGGLKITLAETRRKK
jgi:hypothetical protein